MAPSVLLSHINKSPPKLSFRSSQAVGKHTSLAFNRPVRQHHLYDMNVTSITYEVNVFIPSEGLKHKQPHLHFKRQNEEEQFQSGMVCDRQQWSSDVVHLSPHSGESQMQYHGSRRTPSGTSAFKGTLRGTKQTRRRETLSRTLDRSLPLPVKGCADKRLLGKDTEEHSLTLCGYLCSSVLQVFVRIHIVCCMSMHPLED